VNGDDAREEDQKLDRAIQRAFAGAASLGPQADDDARIDAAISRALVAQETTRASRLNRHRTTVYLVAAALCAGALAYAAVHQGGEGGPAGSGEARPGAAPASTTEPRRDQRAGSTATPEPAASIAAGEAVTPDSLPSVAPPPRASHPAPPLAHPKPSIEAPAADTLGPAELFARANDARRAGETTRAVSLYEQLQSEFPDSREASTSRVALGRLLLDRTGEPGRARALFDRYLERDPTGPLAEEARVGRALAFMRLGDRDAERAAWREVLERHPGSVHAERARQRLGALGD